MVPDPDQGWLRRAQRAVPQLRFALAVPAVAAFFAVARVFTGGSISTVIAVVGGMLGLAILVILFSVLAEKRQSKGISVDLPIKILVWLLTTLIIVFASFATTSLWFGVPLDLRPTKDEQVSSKRSGELHTLPSEVLHGRGDTPDHDDRAPLVADAPVTLPPEKLDGARDNDSTTEPPAAPPAHAKRSPSTMIHDAPLRSEPMSVPSSERLPSPVASTGSPYDLTTPQKTMLTRNLKAMGRHTAHLVVIGGKPQAQALFQTLRDVFQDADWNYPSASIGQLSVVGAYVPDSSYITARDVGNPVVARVYAAFGQAGLKLEFAPGAYIVDGERYEADVVIVLR